MKTLADLPNQSTFELVDLVLLAVELNLSRRLKPIGFERERDLGLDLLHPMLQSCKLRLCRTMTHQGVSLIRSRSMDSEEEREGQ